VRVFACDVWVFWLALVPSVEAKGVSYVYFSVPCGIGWRDWKAEIFFFVIFFIIIFFIIIFIIVIFIIVIFIIVIFFFADFFKVYARGGEAAECPGGADDLGGLFGFGCGARGVQLYLHGQLGAGEVLCGGGQGGEAAADGHGGGGEGLEPVLDGDGALGVGVAGGLDYNPDGTPV